MCNIVKRSRRLDILMNLINEYNQLFNKHSGVSLGLSFDIHVKDSCTPKELSQDEDACASMITSSSVVIKNRHGKKGVIIDDDDISQIKDVLNLN